MANKQYITVKTSREPESREEPFECQERPSLNKSKDGRLTCKQRNIKKNNNNKIGNKTNSSKGAVALLNHRMSMVATTNYPPLEGDFHDDEKMKLGLPR